MAQRFCTQEDAAKQLGISKDRLTQLREAGKVRGYRDGANWKFRGEDIEKLVATGIPAIDPPLSDLDLGSGLSLDMNIGEAAGESPAASSGLDLALTDEDTLPGPAASDVSLEEVDEPTLPAVGEDDSGEASALSADEELLELSDSILLNESELGGATTRPPSTIIGKAELDPEGDLDLTLASDDDTSSAASDVKLASTTSDVLSGGDDSLDLPPPSGSDNFQGLQEVEVDLEAESSRILAPGDAQQAKGKSAAQTKQAAPSSDLTLAPSDSDAARAAGSDIGLGSDAASGAGLTGLSALELAEEPDDQVLGEGSDITLSSESSGINIISPSDSGLALDEVPLSSASMSSPLDLGSGVGQDVALEPLELSEDAIDKGEEPFQLTPLGEGDDEEKDSSQIIALDDLAEEESTGVMFHPEGEDTGVLVEDFSAVGGLTPGMAPAAAPTDDMAFSGPVFAVLTVSLLFLMVCGMMMFDLVRNIWSWEHEVTTLNSTLLEALNPLL